MSGHHLRSLSEAEVMGLARQEARLVAPFTQNKLELEAGKNWDKFYKRNETRFFKDRHWTTREFQELIGSSPTRRVLLEVGCGVGNFFYPLLEDGLDFFVHACDFSPRAVDFVKEHKMFDASRVNAFVCDITKDDLSQQTNSEVDIASMIFVLSAIHPSKFHQALTNLYKSIRPGGIVLFRDYGLYDMAMLRFGPGSKLADRLYVRQDGTRAYYFTEDELSQLFQGAGFTTVTCSCVTRQTTNVKEGVDAKRIFIQAKFVKPTE